MSNLDPRPGEVALDKRPCDGPLLEQLPGREVPLGGARRHDGAALAAEPRPAHGRRLVLRRPLRARRRSGRTGGMDVPPHPHTGLQTVSWLLDGPGPSPGQPRQRRSDRARPAQPDDQRPRHRALGGVGRRPGTLLGVQLWVALPEPARHRAPHFEHHGDLPVVDRTAPGSGWWSGRTASPPRRPLRTPRSSASTCRCTAPRSCALRPDFEHAVLLLSGAAEVEGEPLSVGSLLYVGTDRDELAVAATPGPGCS